MVCRAVSETLIRSSRCGCGIWKLSKQTRLQKAEASKENVTLVSWLPEKKAAEMLVTMVEDLEAQNR